MKILMLRHGKTQGNLSGRYIGRTDEELCESGIRELEEKKTALLQEKESGIAEFFSEISSFLLFSSHMKRCLQTAELLFPGKEIIRIPEFRETDFGLFEGKNYQELNGDPLYQAWIDSGGQLAFPKGESPTEVRDRCIPGFMKLLEVCQKADTGKAAVVLHGGSMMALLEEYARPKQNRYAYQVKNACGFLLEYQETEKELSILSHF